MKYEVKDRDNKTVAVFELKEEAQRYAASQGYTVVEVSFTEEAQIVLPSFLTE